MTIYDRIASGEFNPISNDIIGCEEQKAAHELYVIEENERRFQLFLSAVQKHLFPRDRPATFRMIKTILIAMRYSGKDITKQVQNLEDVMLIASVYHMELSSEL